MVVSYPLMRRMRLHLLGNMVALGGTPLTFAGDQVLSSGEVVLVVRKKNQVTISNRQHMLTKIKIISRFCFNPRTS